MTEPRHWTLDDIDWGRFDATKLDEELIKVVKAAALVEKNGRDYARYLAQVFKDDPEFIAAAKRWGDEEVQHGDALGRWAELADPGFRFEAAFADFADKIRLPENASASVRGSRVGELVSRCMVECGTSSMYSVLAAATNEPVLKQICKHIAADEFRHYKLFYKHKNRYMAREKIGRLRRLWVALRRARETDDDELAYAYYAANHRGDGPYDRATYNNRYAWRIYGYYRVEYLERAVAMALKAIGFKPYGLLNRVITAVSFRLIQRRVRRGRACEAGAAA